MISSAKDAGCERYDFLGIAPPWDIHHHLEGVSDFKSKFGGYIHQWPEKRIALLNPVLYGLYQSIRTIVRVPRYCKALVSKGLIDIFW
jgi:lipid II:glycine glycyltransferase (peptidoglycan interpeptide bridge formation enzyme)